MDGARAARPHPRRADGLKLFLMSTPLICFDAGGTLVRTGRPVGQTYTQLAEHYGLSLDAEQTHARFKEAFAALRGRLLQAAAPDPGDRAWWREVVRQSLGNDVPAEFPLDDFFEEVYAAFARTDVWRVFPEVPDVLRTLKERGCRLAVISNWDSRLREILAGLELAEFFDDVWISSELGMHKPQPQIFKHAAAQAGNIPPANCWMIGDDRVNDVDAPRALGWNAIWIDRPQSDLLAALESILDAHAK